MKTLILFATFCILNFAFCIYANAQIQQNNVRVVDTIYTPAGYPGGPLNSILWLPSVTNGAAVILVHGSWGNPGELHLWGDILSSYGYVVLSMDYYCFFNSYGVPNLYPAPVRAIKTAAEFLRKNSLTFGNYTNKIACIGASEGAQQSARTIIWDNDDAYFGTDPNINDHIDASVLFYGFYDNYNHLESLFNNNPATSLENLLTSYFSLNPANRAGKGNAIANVNNITTPILMFHGINDQIVNVVQSIEFRDSLVDRGKAVTLYEIPGANHVYEFHNAQPLQNFNWNQWSPEGEVSRDTTIAWLARTLQINNIHCPYNKSYWKNHAAEWNADAIPMKLGTTNFYSKAQLLNILNTSAGNDPSRKLAQELISAKLNLANNTVATSIISTIMAADNLIGSRAIPIVPAIASNSSQGAQMIALGNTMNSYNNGTLTPNCSNSGNRMTQNNSSDIISLNIFPNPVSKLTTISFSLNQSQKVSLKFFDVNGRLVSTLADKVFEEGENELTWNAADVNAGIYFLQFQSAENLQTEKLIVTK